MKIKSKENSGGIIYDAGQWIIAEMRIQGEKNEEIKSLKLRANERATTLGETSILKTLDSQPQTSICAETKWF